MKRGAIKDGLIHRIAGIVALLMLCACARPDQASSQQERMQLPVPPLLQDDDPAPGLVLFNLEARQGERAFTGRSVPTYGYNGDYLGPVLRVRRGDSVVVNLHNGIDEVTTLHWHGLKVDGPMDGGPFLLHKPGDRWQVRFTIDQPAATLWYHPHPHGFIGEQIYKGLAGILLIDDDLSDRLPLPKQYGVDDIPLILQDRRFDSDGTMLYRSSIADLVNGMIGNTMVVNGAVNPFLNVGSRKIRFRLLNASNASTYNISLSDGSQFLQIASDGGLLESPVAMTSLSLSPGERAEIVVDFSRYRTGTSVHLVSPGFDILRCIVTRQVRDDTVVPQRLAAIEKIPASSASKIRRFVLSQQGTFVAINDRRFSPDRVDERIDAGATEIWNISNAGMVGMMGGHGGMMGRGGMMGQGGMMMGGGMGHPFHVHSVQFQLLERNGQQPPANERGWKDTVMLYPGEEVTVIARFTHKGTFVYHCHILEHDDLGMMGTFVVE